MAKKRITLTIEIDDHADAAEDIARELIQSLDPECPVENLLANGCSYDIECIRQYAGRTPASMSIKEIQSTGDCLYDNPSMTSGSGWKAKLMPRSYWNNLLKQFPNDATRSAFLNGGIRGVWAHNDFPCFCWVQTIA